MPLITIFNENDWKLLIKQVQDIYNEGNDLIYLHLLHELLLYFSTSNSLKVTLDVLSDQNFILQNVDSYESISNYKFIGGFCDFIYICNDTKHSTKLKQMIEQTGYQLFEAVNKNKIV